MDTECNCDNPNHGICGYCRDVRPRIDTRWIKGPPGRLVGDGICWVWYWDEAVLAQVTTYREVYALFPHAGVLLNPERIDGHIWLNTPMQPVWTL